jgi:outer membrane phospholipase A
VAIQVPHHKSPTSRFPVLPGVLLLGVCLVLAPPFAQAGIDLVAPSRTIDPTAAFRLTLIATADTETRSFSLPEVLRVTLTPELGAAVDMELRRATPVPPELVLRQGEFRRVEYVGVVPPNLRGRVRVDAVDLDAPAMLVQLSTPGAATAESVPATPLSAAAPEPIPVPVTAVTARSNTDPNRQDEGRLSFYEPMFAVVGRGIEANAQFQLSFKLRLYEPSDKTSRRFVDNLYFGYTQASFWDLASESKPFLDTRYVPGLFYYVPSTAWNLGGNAVGIATGLEHESNGRDGTDSRSIDTLFVRPYFTFGDASAFHVTFSPKLYGYLEKSENPDISDYRGYGDYRFTLGKNDDWQIAWILRKGTLSGVGGSDLQVTYPLNRLSPGLAGYLMVQYFTGYGETLLNYNQREPWSLRFGYAISR